MIKKNILCYSPRDDVSWAFLLVVPSCPLGIGVVIIVVVLSRL